MGNRLIPRLGLFLLSWVDCGKETKPNPPGDVIPPGVVSDLHALTVTDSSATLTWTASGDDSTTGTASHDDLRFSTRPESLPGWWDSLGTAVVDPPAPRAPGEAETLLVGGLEKDSLYHAVLRVGDEVPNWSAPSNLAAFRCTTAVLAVDSVPPAAIVDLALRRVTNHTMTLTWTAPGDDGTTGRASTYDVRFGNDSLDAANWADAETPSVPCIPGEPGSRDSVIIAGLPSGAAYFAGVRAVDDAGNAGPLSNIVAAEIPAASDTIPPSRIPVLYAQYRAGGSVFLAWIAPGNDGNLGIAARYEIRYSTETVTDESWESAAIALPAPPPRRAGLFVSTLVRGLPSGDFHFAVRAYDEAGNASAVSANGFASVISCEGDTAPPDAVTTLHVLDLVEDTLRIGWTAPADPGGLVLSYELRISTGALTEANWASIPGRVTVFPAGPPGTQESWTFTGLSLSTSYEVGLKSEDHCENVSALSNVVAVTTVDEDSIPPSAITDLRVENVGEWSGTLRWTAPGDDGPEGTAAAYDLRVYRSPLDLSTWSRASRIPDAPVPEPFGSDQSYELGGLGPGTVL